MVAYTTPNCLPYFTGSDNPCVNTGSVCDPSTVWCDMATLIDAKLSEFDSTINRAVDSFPYAEVAITTVPFVLSSGATNLLTEIVTWDTVLGDSDDIVNLSVDPNTFYLRRSGIWHVKMATVWRSSLADTRLTNTMSVITGAPTLTSVGAFANRTWVEAVPDPGTIVGGGLGLETTMDVFVLVDVSAGFPAAFNMTFSGFAASTFTLTVEQALMSAQWMADLP